MDTIIPHTPHEKARYIVLESGLVPVIQYNGAVVTCVQIRHVFKL